MDTVPNGNVEQKFQEMMAKLTAMPAWTEKQQLELEMARDRHLHGNASSRRSHA
ncbi:MAG: FIG00456423: hypothetical protein [uncultured Paraburkholderia sp.]|nr:MAG: FIG00456423: hypothetical protein [uncultured Paraburkholderia sp.]CAH2917518.1 MAG: FIG00456423: hypothetical protein [uncultured Paraburkholderia sp.]